MANTIKGLTVEIGGDTTKLGEALEDVNKKSRNLSSELRQINKLLKMDPGNAELLAQKQEVLAEAVETTSKKLATLKEAEAQVQAQFERGEASAEQVRELQREIVATEKKLNSYENAARETAEAIEQLGKAGENQSLSKTVDEQRKKLADLKAEYVEVASSQGKHSKAAKDLASQIKTLSGELSDNEKDLKEAEDAADKYDKTIKDADKSSKSFGDTTEGLGSKLGNAAKVGLQAMAAAAGAVVTALVGAAEATRDYREDMGKLETAFTQNGYTAEQATGAYKKLVGVLGESDQAVETANHLALLTDNEKDLATWTGDILPGVFATFGDSLPIEGLTEAANETAKVGQVTGPLADALNWAAVEGETFGVTLKKNTEANKEWNEAVEAAASAEDYFNLALQNCSTEQERQALITETLASLYGDAAEAYKETNAEVIRANEANDAWMESMAGIGAAFEPVMTDVKMLGASLLSDLVPGVEALSEAFRGVLAGDDGAAAALGDALSGIITDLLDKVVEMAPAIVQASISLITSLTTTLVSMLPRLVDVGVSLLTTVLDGLTSAIPQLTEAIVTMIPQLVAALVTGIPQLIEGAQQLFMAMVDAIPQILPTLVEALPQIIMIIVDALVSSVPTLIDATLVLLMAIVEAIPLLIAELVQVLPEILTTIVLCLLDAVPQLLDAAVTLFLAIVEAIPQIVVELIKALPQIWETMKSYLSQLPSKLWAILSSLVQNFVRWGTESAAKALAGASNILSTIVNLLKELPGKVWSSIAGAIDKVATWGSDMASKAKTAASNVVTLVTTKLKELPSKLLSIGKDLVTGLWNGINDKLSWLKNKISSFASSVLSSIKSFFGVHSPSTETAWIGDMLDQGLAEGLLDNINDPVKAMQKVTTGVLGAAGEVDGLALSRDLQNSTAATVTAQIADSGIMGALDKILTAIERGQIITLDGEALVGATYERYDTKLGQRRALAARGALA